MGTEDVEIGITREATELADQALAVGNVCFQQGIERAQCETMAGDGGYPIGKRNFAALMDVFAASEGDVGRWCICSSVCLYVSRDQEHKPCTRPTFSPLFSEH